MIEKTVCTARPGKIGVPGGVGRATEEGPPPGVVPRLTFRGPGAQTGYVLFDAIARCDLGERERSAHSGPANRHRPLDFGQGLEGVRSGPEGFAPPGDAPSERRAAPLPRGSVRLGALTSTSPITATTCTDPATGHGFFGPIQSYRAF